MKVIHCKQTSLAEGSSQPEKFMFCHISSPESAWKVRVQAGHPSTPHRQAGRKRFSEGARRCNERVNMELAFSKQG